MYCLVLLAILFSLIFGQVSAILNQAQKNTAKYHSIIDNMKQFSKLYKLPTNLATRTIDFFMSTWAMNKGIDTDEVGTETFRETFVSSKWIQCHLSPTRPNATVRISQFLFRSRRPLKMESPPPPIFFRKHIDLLREESPQDPTSS